MDWLIVFILYVGLSFVYLTFYVSLTINKRKLGSGWLGDTALNDSEEL